MFIKCKNCSKEYVCAKVLHLHRGKKRKCVHYVEKIRKPNRIPIRLWLQPDKVKKLREERLQKQALIEQQRLLEKEGSTAATQEEANKYIKVKKKFNFWESLKRLFFFWR